MRRLRVVLVKPSKYDRVGFLEQFEKGYMPNAALPYIRALVPASYRDTAIETITIDEYTSLESYLGLFDVSHHGPTLLLLVGVQSHQLHRALDIGAYAASRGCMVVMGGPHPMTCDTAIMHGRGISFVQSEGETVMPEIIADAIDRQELAPIYGANKRWEENLNPPVPYMPERSEMTRYFMPMLGIYPARGCPYKCTYCSVIKIAGRRVRTQPLETTIATLRAARAAKIRVVFFTSDNFNKIPKVKEICQAIIDAKVRLNYFIQCDTKIVDDPELIELLGKMGVSQMFLGVESMSLETLKSVHKMHNRPVKYAEIVRMCEAASINTHFSMINAMPDDTVESAEHQLQEILRINPSMASFYTLCPIPGTEQYDEFKQQGLILEKNLDRFDGACPTWNHPHMSWAEQDALFSKCYRDFYAEERANQYTSVGNQMTNEFMLDYARFARACAGSGDHPMSGGFGRQRIVHMNDFLPLRQKTFDFTYAPLPESLALSPEEEALNRKAKLEPSYA